ncbi:MAG: ParA family protein [Firmicutes bacterium]|nr:ParA family protein [Bacillota bacterium]
MAKTIAVANQKGGVGKTTTAVNLAGWLALMNYRVLLVDIDPQGNASSGVGINKDGLENCIYDVIINEFEVNKIILHQIMDNLDVVPSSIELAGAEVELVAREGREAVLKAALHSVQEKYSYIIIDCPPSLGLLTINALVAADSVLVPIQCEYYALEGVGQLMNTVRLVQQGLNKELKLQGVVLTMFDGRTNLSIQVVDEVKKHFRGKVYRSIIPRNVRLSEAPSHGKPVMVYDRRSRGASVYEDLAKEVIGVG